MATIEAHCTYVACIMLPAAKGMYNMQDYRDLVEPKRPRLASDDVKHAVGYSIEWEYLCLYV